MLAGGLAWMFWPAGKPALETKPVAEKPTVIAATPKLAPTTAVEAPRVTAATPGMALPRRGATVATTNAAENTQQPTLQAETAKAVAASNAALRARVTAVAPDAPVPANMTDLGEVYLTSGVPQQLTLNDGSPVTVTATLMSDGKTQLRFEVERHDTSGKVTGRATVTAITRSGQSLRMQGMDSPNGMPGIRINPHVN